MPGHDDLFLVNPYGLAFSEITASSLIICDFNGNVVEGDGVPEATAFYIHARLHLRRPNARIALHTHMPHTTALAMVEGDPLVWAGQSALKFYGRTAVDENYNGLALDTDEGDRIADTMGDNDIAFLKNHGSLKMRCRCHPLYRRYGRLHRYPEPVHCSFHQQLCAHKT